MAVNSIASGSALTSPGFESMAGHNKWSKVKRLKGVADAKRAKNFAKLAREIGMAVRVAGPDPGMNPRLRMVLLKCRSSNMPADNIERTIKRAVGGDDTAQFEELTYEVYAPGGVAVLVTINTDNRNRTASDIRHIVTKAGASIASAGAVNRLFQRKGQLIISREASNEDELMELALEAGAEDFKVEDEGYEILTEPSQFEAVHEQIEAKNIPCLSAEITSLPLQTTGVDEHTAESLSKLVDALEENEDVSEVFTNAEVSEESR